MQSKVISVAAMRWLMLICTIIAGLATIPAHAAATPAVGMAHTADNGGYWLATQDGAVYSFGNANYFGGANTFSHPAPIVGIAATPSSGGYWLVASDGAVYGFGDAQYKGGANTFSHPAPIVGIAATPSSGGYWLTASDGAVYGFGDAQYKGGANTFPHPAPVVGITAAGSGGYWLVASDGAVYGFGSAGYTGGANTLASHAPIVSLAARSDNGGYWELASDGAVYAYGTSQYFGGAPSSAPSRAQLAQTILNSKNRIELRTVNVSGSDPASAPYQNIVDTANGGKSATSPWSDVGITRVDLSMSLLDAMGKLANNNKFSFTVTEITGGDHTYGSLHYKGRAFDTNYINGEKVKLPRSPLVQSYMNACRSYGATEVLGPGDAGHDDHVHCGWK